MKHSEIFGDLDGYNDKSAGDFDLLPHGTFVLAEIVVVKGKAGACMVESTGQVIQAGLGGNYGHPKFWDHVNFITPKPVDPTADEEGQKKAGQKIGMWARRAEALGLEPEKIKRAYDPDTNPEGFTPEDYFGFFAPAVGRTVIIKTRLEAASGSYKAKSTANDYYADTPANRKKYGLDGPTL